MGKEEIAGLVTALKLYLQQDFAAEEQMWEDMVAFMVADLKDVPGLGWFFKTKSIYDCLLNGRVIAIKQL